MFDYKIYNFEKIIQVDLDDLDENILFDIFLIHSKRTVYVTESNKVIGIVTFGDFKRYLRRKKEGLIKNFSKEKQLINTKFTSISVGEEWKIHTLQKQKEKTFSIPVLDQFGKVVCEYSKEKQNGKKIFNVLKFLFQVYKEIGFIHGKIIYIVIDDWDVDISIQSELKQLNKNIHIIRNLSTKEMKKLKMKGDCFVYDLRFEFIEITPYFYNKFGLDYFYLTDELIYMLQNIQNIFLHFKCVGILDVNHYFAKKGMVNLQIMDSDKLIWNSRYNCYEYKNTKSKMKPEIIYTIFPLSENSYVVWDESFVPICSVLEIDLNRKYGIERYPKVNDSDIALSIIPKLQDWGVKCIVLDNVQSRYSEWKRILKIEPMQVSSKICFNHIFQEIDQQNRWTAIFKNGYTQLADVHINDVNYSFGERCPGDVDDDKLNTIYIFGPCLVWGGYVTDKDSIGYILREKLGNSFNVKAYGGGWNCINYVMREKEYRPGDIVVIFAGDRQEYDLNHIPVFNIMNVYQEIDNIKIHIRDLPYHCDNVVTQNIAERIFYICENEGCLQSQMHSVKRGKLRFGFQGKRQFEVSKELQEWLKSVSKKKVLEAKRSGAIVMNCNPFTKGHRYLIEESAKKVDVLYVFVVEENKSYFSFEDRIEMVQLGVSGLENVVVIPSGKYIISSETLPGYFEKDKNNDLELDATQDLDLFGGVIAKEFEITVRFAGNEPEDAVTRQYNQQMKSILPEYGVEFMEIPRKEIEGKVISASSVRECIKEREYEEVRKFVLPQIYDYLKKHYF